MDKGNDGTLELGASAGVDGGRRESLPHDRLADVGSNEKRDTTAETVALLEELVKENDNQSSGKKLDNEKNADTGTEIRRLAVKTGQDVDAGLAEGQDDGKKLQELASLLPGSRALGISHLLSGLVELAISLEVKVDVNEVGTSKKLDKVSDLLALFEFLIARFSYVPGRPCRKK